MGSIIMSIQKYTKEFKLEILKEHKEHGVSFYKLGKNYNIEPSIIRHWWHVYDIHGESGLDHHDSNLFNYSADFKQMVVRCCVANWDLHKRQIIFGVKGNLIVPLYHNGKIPSWQEA